MKTYQITLTEAEELALSAVAFDPQDWINNVVHERCRLAMEDIVKVAVEQCLNNGVPVPQTKDAIVSLAFSQKWVKTGAEIEAEQAASRSGE
jgi:hypothetical protein